MGKCTAWDSSGTESSDLYSIGSPGNCAIKGVLIVRVVSLSGAKMHRSESQAIFLKLIREQIWINFGYQFVYAACNGFYIFRQLNYIRASVYRILTISNGLQLTGKLFIPVKLHSHICVQMFNYNMVPQKRLLKTGVHNVTTSATPDNWQDLSKVLTTAAMPQHQIWKL